MKELLSICCGAGPDGELSNTFLTGGLDGRCSDCKEMASFIGVIEVSFIKSEFPLGTQNGTNYRVYPSENN